MIVNVVNVYVKTEHLESFRKATEDNHINSLKEEGVLRFDIVQNDKDPSHFIFFEIFQSDDALDFHRQQPHYFKWRDVVADWMDKPRHGSKFNLIFPTHVNK